jgi:uncharacterized protein YbaA (DUF1428 family)
MMDRYVDGFVIPIANSKIESYREMADKAAAIWKEHGALEVWECLGDDFSAPGPVPFPSLLKCSHGEAVLFSWIVFESKEQRDRVNAAVMGDPRLAAMMETNDQPFELARMVYGGFRAIVQR